MYNLLVPLKRLAVFCCWNKKYDTLRLGETIITNSTITSKDIWIKRNWNGKTGLQRKMLSYVLEGFLCEGEQAPIECRHQLNNTTV